MIAWNWPEKVPISEEEELAFEREYQIPVRPGGSLVIARWGMALVIMFIGIAFTTFLLGYFYLRLGQDQWPPAAIESQRLGGVALAVAAIVAAGLLMWRAVRRIRSGDIAGLKVSLALATLLALAGLVRQAGELRGLPFDSQTHAYGSIFHALGWFLVVIGLAGAVMSALTLYWAIRGEYSSRRHVPVDNVAIYWAATVVVWLVGAGVLYLTPRLT